MGCWIPVPLVGGSYLYAVQEIESLSYAASSLHLSHIGVGLQRFLFPCAYHDLLVLGVDTSTKILIRDG